MAKEKGKVSLPYFKLRPRIGVDLAFGLGDLVLPQASDGILEHTLGETFGQILLHRFEDLGDGRRSIHHSEDDGLRFGVQGVLRLLRFGVPIDLLLELSEDLGVVETIGGQEGVDSGVSGVLHSGNPFLVF